MKRPALVIACCSLAACGASESARGPAAETAGEIQALADAEAMLETREDVADAEKAAESEVE